jgi:hypothetical protein
MGQEKERRISSRLGMRKLDKEMHEGKKMAGTSAENSGKKVREATFICQLTGRCDPRRPRSR